MATQVKCELIINTILQTSRKLVARKLGLFMTFLRAKHLPASLHLVGLEWQQKEEFVICGDFKSKYERPALQRRFSVFWQNLPTAVYERKTSVIIPLANDSRTSDKFAWR